MADYTGFPEMMDGRVKTLHPKVHGGILARRGQDDAVMAEHGIEPIDMVVVNLYPFEATVAKPDCTLEDAIENIDIGGPTMVRAAAKNHRFVNIVVNAADYSAILAEMQANGGATSLATRFDLAIKAYEHTAAYDGAIANHFGSLVPGGSATFPRTFNTQFHKVQEMRYGENPHQQAAFYVEANPAEAGIATAQADPGQGAVLQQCGRYRRRAGVRQEFCRAGLRHRQARQPLRCGGSGGYRPGLRPGLCHRHGIRLRRHHRLQPGTGRGHRRSDRRAPVRRGHHRPQRQRRGRSRGGRQEKRAPAGLRRLVSARPRAWTTSGSTAACWCRTATWA